ncbi:MAG: sensor histidine kinase [Lachnospiraceae bacterium]|nr:sensor histidine kinase [Lachnospiraceae bacterium]
MGLMTILKDSLEYTAAAFSCGMTVHCFFEEQIKVTLKKLGIIFLLTALLSALDIIIRSQLGFGILMVFPVFICPAAVLQWGIHSGPGGYIRRAVLMILTEIFICVYSTETVMLCASLSGMNDMAGKAGMSDIQERPALFIMYLAVMILIGLILYFLMIRRGLTLPFRRSDLMLTVAMCAITLLSFGLYLYVEANEPVMFYRQVLEFVLLLLLILLPFVIYKNRQSAYFSEVSAHNESFLEAELEASRRYREAQEETRAFRHDIRNNLNMLSGLLKEKKYKEAEKYISDLTGDLAALSPRIVTGDDMLDSLISSKLGELDRQGIVLTIDGGIDGGLNWPPIDICAVFANAIDNASRACMETEDGSEKYIRISFRKTKLQRVIKISNSTAAKVDCDRLMSGGSRYTTKNDKNDHGYGLMNIRKTVEKYSGLMKLSSTDNEFIITIVLSGEQT